MHDLTRFRVAFYGLKKSHLKELYQIISNAIINSMTDVGIPLELINAYIQSQPKELLFNKTKSRTLVARLNKAVEMVEHLLSIDGHYSDTIEQRHTSLFCNQLLVCEDNYKVCYYPKERLKEYLELFSAE